MIRKVPVHYGRTIIELEIPEKNLQDYVTPRIPTRFISGESLFPASERDRIREAITGKNICILSEDSTRNSPTHEIIAGNLHLFGLAEKITLIIATGSHSSDSGENIALAEKYREAVARAGLDNVNVHIHDCRKDEYVLHGITKNGTPALASSLISDTDLFFTFSDIKLHFLAGYSNPVKLIFPGVVHYDSIERNHSYALDPKTAAGIHPLHPEIERRTNPLANDMYEAFRLIVSDRPVYSLCVISYQKKLIWTKFGLLEETLPSAMLKADEAAMYTVKKADCTIVSPGGHPDDESLYIAQRALELTKAGVNDGGEILFMCECLNGIGPEISIEQFYERMKPPIEEILNYSFDDYKLFSHKPYNFARLIVRLRNLYIYTGLGHDIIDPVHLKKVQDPQKIVDGWIAEKPDVTISVYDGANKLAVYAEN